MIVLPDPKKQIPEQLKSDNWAFHRMARSDDPAYRCQNIGNLVNNLIATLTIAGIDDTVIDYLLVLPESEDENGRIIPARQRVFHTIQDYMNYQVKGANMAWNLYSQGKTGPAVEIASAVLRSVLFLVYDDRFTTSKKDSFIGEVKR